MNAVPSPIYPSSGISQLAIFVFQDNVSRGVIGVRDQAILFKRWRRYNWRREIRKGSGVWASLKILETDTASHAGPRERRVEKLQ